MFCELLLLCKIRSYELSSWSHVSYRLPRVWCLCEGNTLYWCIIGGYRVTCFICEPYLLCVTSKFCSQQMHTLYFVFVRHFTSLPTCFDPYGSSSSGHLIHWTYSSYYYTIHTTSYKVQNNPGNKIFIQEENVWDAPMMIHTDRNMSANL
jgi:hypothetical protein